MIDKVVPVQACDLIVFGGSGDLARRKILPALFHRFVAGQLPPGSRIIGVSRASMTNEDYRNWVREILGEHETASELCAQFDAFRSLLHYLSLDVEQGRGWDELKQTLDGQEDRIRVFYLAVAPELFGTICNTIKERDLKRDNTRLVVEKPIGRDLASARALNDAIAAAFHEEQIYRIDHYLGKETVQNLMVLRFANALFEPLWNSAHIDHVQITVAETLGVGTRAGYYDTSGALRDMVQNHLLQLLCLVAMEPSTSMNADSVRDEKLKVLRALRPIDSSNSDRRTVRGQYAQGASMEGPVPAYSDELGQPGSVTETFVALKAEIDNWRWAGVPFYLRTGKRLASRASEIVVSFKAIPHSIFDEKAGALVENKLILRLQPDEAVKLMIMTKDPGLGGLRLRRVPLDMSFAETFSAPTVDAYERLLMDVVRGDQTLFMRRDEVEAAWRWIDPILGAWEDSPEPPSHYRAGTWGPTSSVALIERDGRTWYEEPTR